jgi:hypothetical protein
MSKNENVADPSKHKFGTAFPIRSYVKRESNLRPDASWILQRVDRPNARKRLEADHA